MNDAHEKILAKIAKCLALAKSSNPNEAAIAWKQAKALMEMHKVGHHQVLAASASTYRSDLGKRPSAWLVKLANTCARAFSCKMITESFIRDEAVFIGTGNNPELASYTFEVLQRQLVSDRRKFVAALSSRFRLSNKRRQGEIFAEHWVSSVWSVIAQFAEIDESTDTIIKAYLETHYPKLTTSTLEPRKLTKKDYRAANAGYQSGANAKLHRAMERDERQQIELLAS